MAYRKARPLLRAPQGAPPLNLNESLTAQLGACFFLNDGGGSLALDTGLARKNGTLTGAATWRASQFGNVLSLPNSGYVNVPEFPGIAPRTDTSFSLCVWAYQNTLQYYNSLGGKTAGNVPDPYDWYIPGTGIVYSTVAVDAGGFSDCFGTVASVAGRWQHHAFTVKMVHAVGITVSQYLDGVPNGSAFFAKTNIDPTGSALRIGSRGDGVTQMDGMLFGWMCFPSYCLSQSEVQQLRAETWRMLAPPRYRIIRTVAAGANNYNTSVAETIAATDAPTGKADLKGAVAETQPNTDASTGVASLIGTLADTQAASDAPTAVRAFVTAVGETLAASDAGSALAALQGTIAEALASTDTATALQAFLAALNENAGSLETLQTAVSYLTALADSLGSLDSFTTPSGNSYATSVSENLATGDVAAATQTLVAALSETAVSSDTAQTAATLLASFADSLTLTDLFSGAGHDYLTSVTDTLSATDAALAASALAGVILEAASVSDLYTARTALQSLLADGVLSADQFASRAAWKALLAEAMGIHDEFVRPAYRKRYGPGRGGSGDVTGAGARAPAGGAAGRAEDGDAVDRINDGGARPR